MSEQVNLPAVPTDTALSREFPDRPDWDALEQLIEGVSGRELYTEQDFGPISLVQIQDADAKVRDYLKVYDSVGGAYWESKWGKAEKALKDSLALFRVPRMAEVHRAEQFRESCLRIMREYKQADDEAIAAKQREIAEQQQKDSDIPPSVSPTQARAALGAPAMPAGIVSNKKPVYDRLITDKRKFIAWLAAHPAYIDVIAMSFSFTAIKNSPVEIDGVTRSLKTTVQNRAK